MYTLRNISSSVHRRWSLFSNYSIYKYIYTHIHVCIYSRIYLSNTEGADILYSSAMQESIATEYLQAVAARAIGHYGQCPPPKNNSKDKTVRLIYNSKTSVNCHIPACFARHSEARDLIISHFVDLSLVRKH